MVRRLENRPVDGQEHDMSQTPDGWYLRAGHGTDLWCWDGKQWTGEHMPQLDGWRDA